MIRRGDVYWIAPGRGIGREQTGRRPGLVIQNDINNEFSESTIVALMTSHQFPRHYPTHVEVPASESGLKESSTVLLEQVMTVAIERLGQPAGHLPSGTMLEVDRALHFALGLLNCSTTD